MKVKVPKTILWRAIRLKCLDCCCGSHKAVADCDIKKCAIWEYRFGKAPNDADDT